MKLHLSFAFFVMIFALSVTANAQESANYSPRLLNIPEANLSGISIDPNISGLITVTVMVNAKGDVTKITNISGPNFVCANNAGSELAKLYDAIRLATQDATFEPSQSNAGVTEYVATVDFNIRPNVDAPHNTDANKPKLIKGGVVNGKATSLPKPAYPPAAKAVRASGAVSVEIVIDERGQVIRAEPISGHPLLRGESASAACRARFSPTTLSSQPVRVSGVIVYNFVP